MSKTTKSTPTKKSTFDHSFNQNMDQIRPNMNSLSRFFSAFIHYKSIDYISDFLARTILRPHLLIAGGCGMIIGSLFFYGIAMIHNISLTGSESLVSFGIGWFIGAIFDFILAGFLNKTD